MQIHELTKSKTINEGIGDIFGLNNPQVKQAWDSIGSELIQNLAAKYTRDPRYANLPIAQRKLAMMRDQNIQDTAEQKFEELFKYVKGVEIKAGAPLTPQQYQALLTNWMNKSVLKGKYSELDPAIKTNVQSVIQTMAKNQNNVEAQKQLLTTLLADEAARMVQVATDLKTAQASLDNPPGQAAAAPKAPAAPAASPAVSGVKSGTPTAAEYANFDQAVANAIKAKI